MTKALVKTADILTIKLDLKILPFIVQDIANLIGLPHALLLVDHYGGTSMWVPKEFKPDHVLAKIVGAESAIKLIEEYGGENIEITKCEAALRTLRNDMIRASDKSQSQLARQWQLTVRQIRNIQHGVVDDRQERLF